MRRPGSRRGSRHLLVRSSSPHPGSPKASFAAAVACAQRGATLISPFVGRIHEWAVPESVDYHARGEIGPWDPKADTGVTAVKKMQRHYKNNGYDTICMPASWRPTSGEGFRKILALAGVDRMTVPPALLGARVEAALRCIVSRALARLVLRDASSPTSSRKILSRVAKLQRADATYTRSRALPRDKRGVHGLF